MRSTSILCFGTFLTTFTLMTQPAMAQEKPSAEDQPISYFLGLDIGTSLKGQGFESSDIDLRVFLQGLADALSGEKSKLNQQQLSEAQGKLQALMMKRQQELTARNKEKGEMFLEQTAKKEGVKKLQGGVLIKTIEEGDGGSPELTDQVKVHYTGKLIDGSVFDSSVARGEPSTFMLNQVIKGWQIGLRQMKVGGKALIFIPSDLAYGPGGNRSIGPNETLVFEVELIDIP